MKKRIIIFILLIFMISTFLFSGCVMVDRDFRLTRNEILDVFGDDFFKTDVQFQIGPEFLTLGKAAMFIANVEPEMRNYLHDIHRLQIGVYQITRRQNRPPQIPKNIEFRLKEYGYQPIIKVKSRDEQVWIFTQIEHNRLRALYIISLDSEELVLLEMKGRLGRLIEKAVKDRGFHKKEIETI